MKHIRPIEYRNKTELPIEPGWYYARHRDADCRPVPYHVTNRGVGRLTPLIVWYDGAEELDDYDFFGPVAECREG